MHDLFLFWWLVWWHHLFWWCWLAGWLAGLRWLSFKGAASPHRTHAGSSHFGADGPKGVECAVDEKPAQKHAGRQASTLHTCSSTEGRQPSNEVMQYVLRMRSMC